MTEILNANTCTFASFEEKVWTYGIVTLVANIVVCCTVGLAIFGVCGALLWKRRASMSAKTFGMHKNLLISLSVQVRSLLRT